MTSCLALNKTAFCQKITTINLAILRLLLLKAPSEAVSSFGRLSQFLASEKRTENIGQKSTKTNQNWPKKRKNCPKKDQN